MDPIIFTNIPFCVVLYVICVFCFYVVGLDYQGSEINLDYNGVSVSLIGKDMS